MSDVKRYDMEQERVPYTEAAAILREHNAWRRGEVTNPMPYNPRMLGEALDAAVAALEASYKHREQVVPLNIALNALAHVGSANYQDRCDDAVRWVEDAAFMTNTTPLPSACAKCKEKTHDAR